MHRAFAATSALCLIQLVASQAAAQQPRFNYPEPPRTAVRLMSDIPFATAGATTLSMDVYRPATSAAPAPALIFFRDSDPGRPTVRQSDEPLKSWARVAAAQGIVAIIPDLRSGSAPEDLRLLLPHLVSRASHYGVDRERLVLFAASGPAAEALPAVEDPRQTAIRAAVIYYGVANVTTFRVDLPVLWVRAGLDHAGMNREIVRLTALAASQNAPVTLLNHHTGHHAFEVVDDDAATRRVIDQTIAFVKDATEPSYQAAIRSRHLDAVAAGLLSVGNYREASLTLAELMKQRPADGRVRFAHAQALLGDRQFAAACAEFRSFTPPNFEAIMPGTRSCVLAGTPDTAIVWLQRFRRDWMQSEYLRPLRTDSVFAPLWARAEFQALFRRADSVGTSR